MLVSPFNKIKRYLGYIQILIAENSGQILKLSDKMYKSSKNVF